MNTVLYIREIKRSYSTDDKLIGVREIAERAEWQLQILNIEITRQSLRKLINFWQPIGIITECGSEQPSLFSSICRIPIVFIDPSQKKSSKQFFYVQHNSLKTGELAAKELLVARGGVCSFAFVCHPENHIWSEDRLKGFSETLQLNGHTPQVFRSTVKNINAPEFNIELNEFLSRLPLPCALFAANDSIADKVIVTANALNIPIPDKLSVLGVDNFIPICEHTNPTLSSIRPDFRGCGRLSAMMLLAAIRFGNKFRGIRTREYESLQIIRRGSTRIQTIFSDEKINAVLEYIRNEACNGLTAENVLKRMPYSRSVAISQFRTMTGKSILEMIHSIQLERAKELLSYPNQTIKSIHDFCGFKNANSLRKFFLRETGMTMTNYRKTLNLGTNA